MVIFRLQKLILSTFINESVWLSVTTHCFYLIIWLCDKIQNQLDTTGWLVGWLAFSVSLWLRCIILSGFMSGAQHLNSLLIWNFSFEIEMNTLMRIQRCELSSMHSHMYMYLYEAVNARAFSLDTVKLCCLQFSVVVRVWHHDFLVNLIFVQIFSRKKIIIYYLKA